MTWGFEATNESGQVLVSSDTRNLHFAGKATLNRIIRQFDGYGGLRHYAFWIDCDATPLPFFTMPTSDYYGIVAVRKVDGSRTWEIELIRSGTSSLIPEIYVFCEPGGINRQTGTDYGMQVFTNNGSLSFDSRLAPMVVTGGISVQPPSNPLLIGPNRLDPRFCRSDPGNQMGPDNRNTYAFTVSGSKPIFFFPSVAQAEREFSYYASEEECDGLDAYGNCVGAKRNYSWTSYYWAFYRGGIRYVGGYLYAGWITAHYGCNWNYKKDSAFLGIGTGGSSNTDGKWPYSNETLNLTPTTVITSNGARYD